MAVSDVLANTIRVTKLVALTTVIDDLCAVRKLVGVVSIDGFVASHADTFVLVSDELAVETNARARS